MTKDDLKKQAELSLCIALPTIIPKINQAGRLNGMVNKIAKHAIKEVDKIQVPNKDEQSILIKAFDDFEKLTKWDKKPRHLITYLSAISAIIIDRGYHKINEGITDIIDHFERKNSVPAACYWSGHISKEKWEKVWS
jgi:hypothetical protein